MFNWKPHINFFPKTKIEYKIKVKDNDFVLTLFVIVPRTKVIRLFEFAKKKGKTKDIPFEKIEKQKFWIQKETPYFEYIQSGFIKSLKAIEKDLIKKGHSFKIERTDLKPILFEKISEKDYLVTCNFQGLCDS